MNVPSTTETGITSMVLSYFSDYSILNVIEEICEKKIRSILKWIHLLHINPTRWLIIGSYLTGIRLANYLCPSYNVTVVDIYPHLQGFFHPGVRFVGDVSRIKNEPFDVIVDTSGLGGISLEDLHAFQPPKAHIIEDPCSDGSDDYTKDSHHPNALFHSLSSLHQGLLYTHGLHTKTSGTMSLTIEVIRRSMDDALTHEGVLYSSSHLDFFERILFKEKNSSKFFEKLTDSALIISSLIPVDINVIVEKNLEKIESQVITKSVLSS